MEATTVEIWNALGTWVAGIGTISAVITSLWLARNVNEVKLKIKVSSRILIDPSITDHPKLCYIEIVNIGNKIAKITTIGWKIERGKEKKEFYQNTNGSRGEKTPFTLDEGMDATIIIDFNGKANWLTTMAEHTKGFNIDDLKLIVVTNIKTFEIKIDKNLAKAIKEERKRLSKD